MDWDDEDEKTAVFDKSGNEDAATALLRSNPPAAPMGGAGALAQSSGGAAPSMPRPPQAPMAPQQAVPSAAPAYPSAVPAPPTSNTGRTIAIATALLLVVGLAAAIVLLVLPRQGALIVTAAGPGNKQVDAVQVFVDGVKKCDASPCKVGDLDPGTHMVKVSAAGYQATADQAVRVEGGDEAVLNVTLARASEGTGIKVTAEGSGLTLYVDDEEVGPLPQTLKDMTPGEHTIKVGGSDRYEPYEKKIIVKADEMQKIGPLKLKVIKGLARIEAGEGADKAKVLLVSGSERRPIPKLPIKIEIEVDKSYKLVAKRKGYEDFEQEITFEDGKAERTFTVDMTEEGEEKPVVRAGPRPRPRPGPKPKPKPEAAPSGNGTLNMNSIPVSNVILDGRPMGTTPKVGVSVSAGAHTVVFVHPEHGRKVRSVSVPAGGSATAAVRFP